MPLPLNLMFIFCSKRSEADPENPDRRGLRNNGKRTSLPPPDPSIHVSRDAHYSILREFDNISWLKRDFSNNTGKEEGRLPPPAPKSPPDIKYDKPIHIILALNYSRTRSVHIHTYKSIHEYTYIIYN